jgi:hypothetical protein
VVAGASVTVTNQGTGIALKTTTDSTGNFVVTPLAVGTYSVAVESAGFKKSVSSNITVNVQERVRVDAALQVGEIVDTVEVAASAPLLQTDTSYLGQVVESQRIVDLPLNGRYFSRLAILTAGTAPTPAGARDEKTGGFSSNGVRPYQNNFLLDGVDNNSMSEDMVNQASYVVGPPPDAIAEFKVQTNSMSAEFGRSGGAVLNVTIKSGTNALHGTVYEFLRNSALDAKNYFDSPTDPIPPFKLNQFGFSTGGPIVKNRTFFFFDYQGTRQRTGHTFFATLPPPAWRNGDFSGFRPIFDPATTTVDANGNAVRQPFANNQIPQDRWNPIAKKLMDAFPAPSIAGSVDETGVSNNYLTNPVEPDTTNHFDVRIDHKISDSDSIFGRLSFEQSPDAAGRHTAAHRRGRFRIGRFLEQRAQRGHHGNPHLYSQDGQRTAVGVFAQSIGTLAVQLRQEPRARIRHPGRPIRTDERRPAAVQRRWPQQLRQRSVSADGRDTKCLPHCRQPEPDPGSPHHQDRRGDQAASKFHHSAAALSARRAELFGQRHARRQSGQRFGSGSGRFPAGTPRQRDPLVLYR